MVHASSLTKMQALVEALRPTSVQELQSLLRLSEHCINFVPGFAQIARLHLLSVKNFCCTSSTCATFDEQSSGVTGSYYNDLTE